MTNLKVRSKNIVTPNGVVSGVLHINNGHFGDIYPIDSNYDHDYGEHILFPGIVDIHIHGWGRGSFGYRGDYQSLKYMSEDLVKVGVTSYLPTSGVMPNDFLEQSLINARSFIEDYHPKMGAEPVGVHMEGPFINEKHLGLQRKDAIQLPSIETFKKFHHLSGNNIKLMTLAPEITGSLALISYLSKNNITVSAGHTDATFDEIKKAIDAGLKHFTHAYSAMRSFHHRELGVVGALMYFQDTYAEVAKQTGITIKPEAFDILYRLKTDERLVMMSDCMGYADFQEGYPFYHYLRQQHFLIKGDYLNITSDSKEEQINRHDYEQVKHLELSHLESMKNVFERVNNGWISLSKLACSNPAKLVNIDEKKGAIEKGKEADFIILTSNFDLIETYCSGLPQLN